MGVALAMGGQDRAMAALVALPLAALLLLVPVLPGAGPARAMPAAGALAVRGDPAETEVRLALSAPVAGPLAARVLDSPPRLAIDIPGASSLKRTATGAGMVASARVAQFNSGTVRIVLDLAVPAEVAAARLAPGPVLVLRLRPVPAARFSARTREGPALLELAAEPGPAAAGAQAEAALPGVEAALSSPDRTAPARPAVVPAEQLRRSRARPLVVIDPGHGGKDVGAIAVSGQHEKDVTLAVAKAAARQLERSGKVDVRLTRSDDRFLTLGERVRLARAWGADLFISVHADSAPNPQARGASVYTLSETASDREAARLAAKENRADAIAGQDLSGLDGEAQTVLIDLAMRDSMNASADFAAMLQSGLEPRGVLFRQQFHRFAGFAVLRNLGVPAVLLECGYLSNSEDAAYLFSARGQKALGEGVARAAEAWLAAGRQR
jgi:N-acetylmuramoyl-L-alanine amidase